MTFKEATAAIGGFFALVIAVTVMIVNADLNSREQDVQASATNTRVPGVRYTVYYTWPDEPSRGFVWPTNFAHSSPAEGGQPVIPEAGGQGVINTPTPLITPFKVSTASDPTRTVAPTWTYQPTWTARPTSTLVPTWTPRPTDCNCVILTNTPTP